MNQTSLGNFDKEIKKKLFKVMTQKKKEKYFLYIEAFSIGELEEKYPKAKITEVGK